jgi:osmotically inducible protein OsmC
MALSNILAEHGHQPESVKTGARVHLRNVDGAPTIARIELDVEARVADIEHDHFQEHADEAKAGCPVSRALASVPEIEMNARLA